MAKAAEALSAGDVANRSVRQYGNWGLMPFAAAMGSATPAAYMRGSRETFGLYPTEPNFPRCVFWIYYRRYSGCLTACSLTPGNASWIASLLACAAAARPLACTPASPTSRGACLPACQPALSGSISAHMHGRRCMPPERLLPLGYLRLLI